MTGYENFRRAICFESPAYLPVRIACRLDWLQDRDTGKINRIRQLQEALPRDWLAVGGIYGMVGQAETNGTNRSWFDEWGTRWTDDGIGPKAVSHPLESGYDSLGGFRFPDPLAQCEFYGVDPALSERDNRYVYGTVWFALFERLWMLRGFDNILMDPYLDQSNFEKLRDAVLEFNLVKIDELLKRNVHAIFFSDDWGTQRGMLINPEDWRRYYKTAYKRMFDRVRAAGAQVWMHSCGNVMDIIPDLIELGLNVLNPVQPQAMNVVELSRRFGGRLCFHGGVDVQGTLIHGHPAEIKKEVLGLCELFGRYNGGYIGGTSHSIMPETPLDNIICLYETFLEHTAS